MAHILSWILVGALQGTGSAQPARQDSRAFMDRLDYYIRNGGEWVSMNQDYKAGGEQPQSFGYLWEWSLGRRVARLRIDGRFDDGRRATFWETTVAWHPTEERAIMHQVGSAGAYADGWIAWPDDRTTEIRLTFHMPDGEIWAFREIDTIIGPDEFRTVSYRLQSGTWTPRRTATWTRSRRPAARESGKKGLPARGCGSGRPVCLFDPQSDGRLDAGGVPRGNVRRGRRGGNQQG